ncbi:MAG: T9SS type A sorting domain-containing protein [Candidatus Stahlbacteria bacterium]|nr:T9SS type A sorting domain-containing protein [Candidatus Stahlbacteria bacterium]
MIEGRCNPSGIEENKVEQDEGFRLLPSRKNVKVLYGMGGQFRLYNVAGRKVSEASLIGKGEITIKVPSAGIYFATLKSDSKYIAKKVVIF